MSTRFIFITGGVVSSIGKGLASASIGALLQARGYSVRLRKLDPYLNVDPGTMNPNQHGEVFVTEDGAETDLDLGHYERFTGVDAKKTDNVTTGQIYSTLLKKERKGDYLGGTVQVIPHVTDLIKNFIKAETKNEDFVLCEIGGTVGDIEGLPFFEAIRQLGYEMGHSKVMFIHVTLLPYLKAAKELKTKPTQHSVKELRTIGIQPDLILCRCEHEIPEGEKKKIALFCNVKEDCVIQAVDLDTLYKVPVNYHAEGLDRQIIRHFGIKHAKRLNLNIWHNIIDSKKKAKDETRIAIIGKYTGIGDAYKSIEQALEHAGMATGTNVKIKWVDAKGFERKDHKKILEGVGGILVPGGFGDRGVKGKMAAIKYARENNIAYFGICFGMQLAAIEYARNVLGIKEANSSELEEYKGDGQVLYKGPLIGLMKEWDKAGTRQTRSKEGDLGGTMRLGAYPAVLKKNSKVAGIYGSGEISERHRHRYEFNSAYIEDFEKSGMLISATSPDGELPEIIELKNHKWFIAVQFHPEFKSRPYKVHPLFKSFVKAAKS